MRRTIGNQMPRTPPRACAVTATEPIQPRLSRRLVLLLAIACGAAVANNYYAQPLLHTIAGAFGVRYAIAGLLVTAAQAGYATGLVLFVPLGDLVERGRLVTTMLLVTAAGQALAAAAPRFAVLAGALAIVGTTSVVAQIIVPMAASLASSNERGQVVGTVMSGLIVGILVARMISGLIASAFGWRAVFTMAASIMIVLAIILSRVLPHDRPGVSMSYGALLRSVVPIIRQERALRERMVLGAAAMGCFSILWTPIAFLLSGPPYHYGTAVIGLFGLAGLAGAIAAPLAGRLADRGHGRLATLGAAVILLASWGLLALGARSLAALIAGVVLLDLGAQALHISNQSVIYALSPEVRSRVNTAYMVAFFVGGAAMSAVASVTYSVAGWKGVCALGAATAGTALGFWFMTRNR
jgi:predicted MFS family arabinose efflux permease